MSRLRANQITNENANGAPNFPHGITVTGVVTATTSATSMSQIVVGSAVTANSNGVDTIGIVTAGTFKNKAGGTFAPNPTTTQGDLIVRGASANERLAIGAAGKALKVNASANGLEYGTAGRILQLVVNEKSDVVSQSGTNQSGFVDVSGINVTITPTVASSKILVHFCLGKVSHSSNSTGVRFTRSVAGGSASIIKVGDADGNRKQVSSNIMGSGMINAAHAMEFIYQFVDTPTYSVGQAIVYQMQVNNEGSGNFYVNRSGDDSNDTYIYRGRAFSTITAMEVSA